MKKLYKILTLLFFSIPLFGFSNNDFSHTKQKTISKAYIVNSDAGVSIDNSYGSIFVTTWNEDKIEIEVVIKVSGDSEKWVNQKLSSIDVEFIGLTNLVTAKTVFKNNSFNNNGRNNNFEINYTIKIPKKGSVKLKNKYGNINTADLFASTDINCKYGKINLGRLNGNVNEIEIGYCTKSMIEFLKSGNITAKYSGLKVNEATKVNLNSDYSDFSSTTINDLKYNSKYGSIVLQNVNSLDGNGDYLSIDIGTMSNNLKINTKYSSLKIESIQTTANNVSIISGYSGVTIGFQPNYVFDFDITAKYADFKYNSNELEVISREETNYTKKVSGYHKKKGVNKVFITSDYGNIKLFKNQ